MAKTADRRKVLAILAGGLVLGVGAAVTLAAWNDSEFAGGDFAAGTFNLEGSTDNVTFEEHASADGAATLEFATDTSNMVPSETAYSSFYVRLDGSTTVGGTMMQNSVSGQGEVGQFSYAVAAIDSATCDAAAITGGTELGSGESLADGGGTGNSVELRIGDDDAAGDVVHLCIAVTASDDLVQGAAASATWEFLATSNDAS